jgi:hypothetical protein
VLSAVLLCGLVLVCEQGSLTIITHKPAISRVRTAALPSWMKWCSRGVPREERIRLAFCARIEGRVIASTQGPNPGEAHVAVISDFHLVLVRLPSWDAAPKKGARVVAIGPLFRARDGQREIQAFWYDAA